MLAKQGLVTTGVVAVGTRLYPPIGVIYTTGSIISQTETYQQALHDARVRATYDPNTTPITKIESFSQGNDWTLKRN